MNYSRYVETTVLHSSNILDVIEEMSDLLLTEAWEPLGPVAQLSENASVVSRGAELIIRRGDWFVALARTRELSEYQILSADNIPELEVAVEEAMANSWRLKGGCATAVHPNGTRIHCQAMER